MSPLSWTWWGGILLLAICDVGQAAGPFPFQNVSLSWEERVADLVGRLTLEEIQLQMARGGAGDIGGPAPAIERLGIDKFRWDTECLRGDVGAGNATAFPQAIGLAATFSPDLIFRIAEATGVEVRGKHNDFVKLGNYSTHTGLACLSPVINIMRDPRWGRNQETYGEDPFLSGVFAAHFIWGLQGNHTRYVRASGGCKHFDAYGGPDNIPVSSISFDAKVSETDLRTTFLPAFRRCVEAGSYSLMCCYSSMNGVPACANKKLLTDIPRGEWGFTGYIISDQGAIENIIEWHHYFNNSVDTVAACVNAGCNLEISNNIKTPVYFSMLEAIRQNKLTEPKVREMVAPLFYTRMRLGEFDPPEMNPYSTLTSAVVETPEHKTLSLEAAMKSFVLLKNNGFLPLSKSSYANIAVIGPMADNPDQLFGDYAPQPPAEDVTTPLAGLRPLSSSVHYTSGCNDTHCRSYQSQEVLDVLKNNNDIVFVALGTGQVVESEGNDRPDTELPGQQKTLLQDVISHTHANTSIVLLLFTASPVNISFADQDSRVSAIMECFFPAQATGEAIRHVLLNDIPGAVPAGRLPFTWYMTATQIPPITDYSMQGRTYRYLEEDPLYPFGYGLSYTTFEYVSDAHPASIPAGQPLTGSFWIRNTGNFDADEVSQVYIRWRNDTLPAPKIQLVWFDRYTVPKGGNDVKVDFEIEARSMAVWQDDGWYIMAGMMDLFIGGEQPFQARRGETTSIQTEFEISGSVFLGKY